MQTEHNQERMVGSQNLRNSRSTTTIGSRNDDEDDDDSSQSRQRQRRRLPLHTEVSHPTHTSQETLSSFSSSSDRSPWWILFQSIRNTVMPPWPFQFTNNDENHPQHHNSNYILWGNHHTGRHANNTSHNAALMASIFWRDYEHSRAPTLPVHMINTINDPDDKHDDDTSKIFLYHGIKFSSTWKTMRVIAVVLLLTATHWESSSAVAGLLVHGGVFGIFTADMWFRHHIGLPGDPWQTIMQLFMTAYATEACLRLLFLQQSTTTQFFWTSLAKPVAIVFASDKARRAALALLRVTHVVLRVLVLEVLLILAFAVAAVSLFASSSDNSSSSSFGSLSQAWLSLFQLSTTVVNPSLWMPMYEESKASALFFVLFLIVTTLYLHSLVLSVVFQTYIQASKEVDALSLEHREEALRLSFAVLQGPEGKMSNHMVRHAVQNLRPHYADAKINALMDIYTQQNSLLEPMHFPDFRQRIQQVIHASIRTAPTRTIFSISVEGLTTFVAVANVIFVLLFSSSSTSWKSSESLGFETTRLLLGYTLTSLGLLDLLIRVDMFQCFNFIPLTKVKPFFDSMAALAVITSFLGICYPRTRVEFLMVGRSMDIVRMMRFQRIFRDVVRRSGDILPALVGPLSLLIVVNHVFVFVGMALWGGAVDVGRYENIITARYDLNNFNSYLEGVVTMFNVLIVNDWHAIAEVFTFASRHSEGYIVYPYFVAANLVNVGILLNCVTAFFVGAFTTKMEEEKHVDRDDMFLLGRKSTQPKLDAVSTPLNHTHHTGYVLPEFTEPAELKVYERPTYDKIMDTITGDGGRNGFTEKARQICDNIGVFESLLPPSSQEVGFLVFSDAILSQCGSCRFYSITERFVDVNQIQDVLQELHSRLVGGGTTVVDSMEKLCVSESFEDGKARQVLTIKSNLIKDQPAVSLHSAFVTNIA